MALMVCWALVVCLALFYSGGSCGSSVSKSCPDNGLCHKYLPVLLCYFFVALMALLALMSSGSFCSFCSNSVYSSYDLFGFYCFLGSYGMDIGSYWWLLWLFRRDGGSYWRLLFWLLFTALMALLALLPVALMDCSSGSSWFVLKRRARVFNTTISKKGVNTDCVNESQNSTTQQWWNYIIPWAEREFGAAAQPW